MTGKNSEIEKTIGENTFIPLSIALAIVGAVFIFGQFSSRVEANSLRIEQFEKRLNTLEDKLHKILQTLARIEERLEKRR
jgi:chaperonin cofactor prefoldin